MLPALSPAIQEVCVILATLREAGDDLLASACGILDSRFKDDVML